MNTICNAISTSWIDNLQLTQINWTPSIAERVLLKDKDYFKSKFPLLNFKWNLINKIESKDDLGYKQILKLMKKVLLIRSIHCGIRTDSTGMKSQIDGTYVLRFLIPKFSVDSPSFCASNRKIFFVKILYRKTFSKEVFFSATCRSLQTLFKHSSWWWSLFDHLSFEPPFSRKSSHRQGAFIGIFFS